MTNGGLMQLVAYGAQDVYLTSNPQVTFFKQLYRRHSNFAMEAVEQTFNGIANFSKRVTCTVGRNGDLIHKMYLQVTLPSVQASDFANPNSSTNKFSWVPYIGQYLISNVEVEIGGQRIDKHWGEWLHLWNELTLPAGKKLGYLNMVNGTGGVRLTNLSSNPASCSACAIEPVATFANATACSNPSIASMGEDCFFTSHVTGSYDVSGDCMPQQTLYVPFEFWFNRHTGLALPLIALQYHEVKINVQFNDLQYLVNCNDAIAIANVNDKGLVACSLYIDYIYLDTEERRRFAQVAHEYLIEQLQFTGSESITSSFNKVQMSFNHPVKELVWIVQNPAYVDCKSLTNAPWRYSDAQMGNPVAVAKIQLNGQDRFSEREGKYFNYVQPYQHHTSTPSTGINVYSFAIKPEDLQPSGSCNFSRIDSAVVTMTMTPSTFLTTVVDINDMATVNGQQPSASVRIYATNYNVLRITSGMGGLAYSN